MVDGGLWIWIGAAVIVALTIVLDWWRRRSQSGYVPRLVSIVALLREPIVIDQVRLAAAAKQASKASLGMGNSPVPSASIVGNETSKVVIHIGRRVLVNAVAAPYAQDLGETAEGIPVVRIRSLFLAHRAWFSCDAMGVDASTTPEEVREWYRNLGPLVAELLDDRCLLLYLPDCDRGYPINAETLKALRSDDPAGALQATVTPPFVLVPDNDADMQAAMALARERWQEFVAAFQAGSGNDFCIKAPISHGDNTEFIWIRVKRLEGERVWGELENEPVDLGPLKRGSAVTVPQGEVVDWIYVDTHGEPVGGFTLEAVARAAGFTPEQEEPT